MSRKMGPDILALKRFFRVIDSNEPLDLPAKMALVGYIKDRLIDHPPKRATAAVAEAEPQDWGKQLDNIYKHGPLGKLLDTNE